MIEITEQEYQKTLKDADIETQSGKDFEARRDRLHLKKLNDIFNAKLKER